MTTEQSTFINKLIQNKNKHECICELLDCSGNTYYHPYFDIEHYDNDTTIEFNIDTTLEFICHQFGVNRNDMALSSNIRENVKQSYHCVLFTKRAKGSDLKIWARKNKEELKKLSIDGGVYGTKMQKFRCLFGIKPDDNLSKGLIPLTQDVDKHIIQLNSHEQCNCILWEFIEHEKIPKKTKEEKIAHSVIDTIYELLKNKCNDTTSVYMPTYAASQEPNTFYFKANGERSCPSGKTHHHNNNFIVKFDDKTNKLIYICLAPTCEDNKVFTLATFNGTKVVNDYYFDDLGVKK